MRVLGHIHTFNDEAVIDRPVGALLAQTYPLEELLVVDNASTDDTLKRASRSNVHVIRHSENLGTSGAVVSGMKYALERDFDWIWIFDADAAPRPDALERLLVFYAGLEEERQQKVQTLASVCLNPSLPYHGVIFTARGWQNVERDRGAPVYRCDAVIWCGSLFKVDTIRKIGLPSMDYVLDWGEFEYGYQGRKRGYTTYVIQSSVFEHNLGGQPSLQVSRVTWGPLSFKLVDLPAIRLYYLVRNELYFWLHEYEGRTASLYVWLLRRYTWLPKYIIKLVLLRRWTDLQACLRGAWDGVFKRMERRYLFR